MGNNALITGASGGLGRELAILFSKTSNHVILSGRSIEGLEGTRIACADPNNTSIICSNLRNIATCQRLAYYADLYSIRYLVLSAGEYLKGKFGEQDLTWISDVLSSNTVATIQLIRHIFPYLQPGASIIHINSVAGKNIAVDEAVYSASKHAMTGFLKSFRFEARDKGVRVLDVFPGAIQTPMTVGREGYDHMMWAKEVATAIHTTAMLGLSSLQIEELHLGRLKT